MHMAANCKVGTAAISRVVLQLLLLLLLVTGGSLADHETWPLSGGFRMAQNSLQVPPSNDNTASVLVTFPAGTFQQEDPVDVTIVSITSPQLPGTIFEHFKPELSSANTGFRVYVFAGEPWQYDLVLTWQAQTRAACRSHDECPDSQYCDIYGGCDDVRVCLALGDTVDKSPCPVATTTPTATTPTTLIEAVTAERLSQSTLSADGTDQLDHWPEPCVECPMETMACGEGCVPVRGPDPGLCTQRPNCAVDFRRGSSAAYPSLYRLQQLSTDNITASKANLARGRALEILGSHPSFVRLDVRAKAVLAVADDVLSCIGVVCPVPGQCQEAMECHNGVCPPLPDKADQSPCDDGVACTENDRCFAGFCNGLDTCSSPEAQCMAAYCDTESGLCATNPIYEGQACNSTDLCIVDPRCSAGVCQGQPRNCTALESLCTVGVCVPESGLCQAQPRREGLECDDEDPCTHQDICMAGICSGITLDCTSLDDQCNTGVCEPSTGECRPQAARDTEPCFEACLVGQEGVCQRGLCSGVPLDCSNLNDQCNDGVCVDGTCFQDPSAYVGARCDDDKPHTDFDTCTQEGLCMGVDLCEDVICKDPGPCRSGGACAHGVCPTIVNKDNGLDCDDGLEETDEDACEDGVCRGINYCDFVECQPNQCQFKGTCLRGNCSFVNQPDGTHCDDGDASTDFDNCFQGECAGIFQPTMGPNLDAMAYQTEARIELIFEAEFDDIEALLAFLSQWLLDNFPGVYDDLLQLFENNNTPDRLRRTENGEMTTQEPSSTGVLIDILITTSPFGRDYVIAMLYKLLQMAEFRAALEQRFPAFRNVSLIGEINDAFRCLTPIECPVLNCSSGMIEYQASYVSVRKCCKVCILQRDFYAMELQAYQEASLHWAEAQAEQDRRYRENDLARFQNVSAAYEQEYAEWLQAVSLWDEEWTQYINSETGYFRNQCSQSP